MLEELSRKAGVLFLRESVILFTISHAKAAFIICTRRQSQANSWSITTSDRTIPLWMFGATPYVVINVWQRAFFVFVTLRNRLALLRNRSSYSASISYLSETYLISQILITSSARSIRRSICAPFHFLPFASVNGLQLHESPAIYRYQFGLATCQIITDERLFVFTPYNLAFSHIQFALASAKISKLFKKTI